MDDNDLTLGGRTGASGGDKNNSDAIGGFFNDWLRTGSDLVAAGCC